MTAKHRLAPAGERLRGSFTRPRAAQGEVPGQRLARERMEDTFEVFAFRGRNRRGFAGGGLGRSASASNILPEETGVSEAS
mgnify:CR=1 FL=1